jgi:biopolymer transport protein ExbD
MPKVKVKRQSVSLDMTAMCDVAFLLLTFFMLTAKFRPDEAVTITPPTSISEKAIPPKGFITFSVSPDGQIYMGVEKRETREFMLDRMTNRFGVALSANQKENFLNSEVFGYPMAAMTKATELTSTELKSSNLPKGIPCDTTQAGQELGLWVGYARMQDPTLQVAIKGDANSAYKTFNMIIGTLQAQNINVFQLVTGPENKPR